MMERARSTSVHMVGLGSAGTSIVESFLNDGKTFRLLEKESTRLSLLAIDIADPEIGNLQESHRKILKRMEGKGLPKERVSLTAKSVKISSADALFDFVRKKYPDHLTREEVKLENYNQWLPSRMTIPPLPGGVGRRRALGKAVYALNFYQLGTISSLLNTFKEQTLSSLVTPIVLIVFGLGGGTGSGMVFDFGRHLRKVLGSGVPIVGLCILPCRGDDPPAKGHSAYTSLTELSLLLNKDYNDQLRDTYGDVYSNPFNAFFFLPLATAYSKVGNIISARDELDEMIVDIMHLMMDFDVADLFSGVGREVGLTDQSIHNMWLVKVTYPVDQYISAFKVYLEKLTQLRQLRAEKVNLIKNIQKITTLRNREAVELYRKYLISTGDYNEEEFEDRVKETIYGSARFEEDYKLHLRSIEEQIQDWIGELMKFLSTIQMSAEEGSTEEAIVNLTLHTERSKEPDNLEDLLTNITKTHLDFSDKKETIFERLKQLIPSSQKFTIRQKKLLGDLMNLTELVEKALSILKLYDETRVLNDILIRYYTGAPHSQETVEELKTVRSELLMVYNLLQSTLTTPTDEAKIIDEHLTHLHGILTKLRDQKAETDNKLERIEEKIKRLQFDQEKLEKKLEGIWPWGKKYAKEKLAELKRQMKKMRSEKEYTLEESARRKEVIDIYKELVKKIEVTSQYRKTLNQVLGLSKDYQEKLANIIKPKKFFERTTELTKGEQMKIIQKILAEEEESLSREGILDEILDKDHFKDYMKSVIRVFRTPSVLGFKPEYRSDYLWVTVQTPLGLWSEDLTQELNTALAEYVTGEVSRTVTVRVIDSREPWVIRILTIAGRGKVENIRGYDKMKQMFQKSTDLEKHLSRSFLIEHGEKAEELAEKLGS